MARREGRKVEITDGGSIVFHESNENGSFKVSIKVPGDLTADRTMVLADKDGVIGGLGVGEVWGVDQGGTGRSSFEPRRILVGGTTGSLDSIEAPSVDNTFLVWNGVQSKNEWVPIDLSGVEATSARNIDPAKPGPYVHKLGSELRFRNIGVGSGLTINQSDTDITIGYNPNNFPLPASQITGTLLAARGGTGQSAIQNRAILVGDAFGNWNQLPAPTQGNMYLRSNDANTNVQWARDTATEHDSGEIKYPSTENYQLCLSFPFAAKIESLTIKTGQGSVNYNFLKNAVTFASGTATPAKSTTALVGQTIAVGDEMRVSLANILNSCKDLAWTIVYSRV